MIPSRAQVYINHGGGPLPLLGNQPGIAKFLGSYASTLPCKPTAILVVTAHWETGSQLKVSGGKTHSLYFDYGGFPKALSRLGGASVEPSAHIMSWDFFHWVVSSRFQPFQESYEYTFPAPGSPELSARTISLLAEKGLKCTADSSRGWDHGVFVPLMLMFPDASVPVVSISLYSSQDAAQHMKAGEALQRLRDEGVLIVGSGASFHNFGYFFVSLASALFSLSFFIPRIWCVRDIFRASFQLVGNLLKLFFGEVAGKRCIGPKQRREAVPALSQLAGRNSAVGGDHPRGCFKSIQLPQAATYPEAVA